MRKNIKLVSCLLTLGLFVALNIIMQSISFGAGEDSNPWAIVSALVGILSFLAFVIYFTRKSKKNQPAFY